MLNTLWLFNSLQSERQMWWGDAQLMKDAAETEYLHFSEKRTITGNGADPRNVPPIKLKLSRLHINHVNEIL